MNDPVENLKDTFTRLSNNNEGAFIPFLTIGDPNPNTFLEIIDAISKNADVIELGIPFSDPLADGPTIQKANERARSAGVNLNQSYHLIKKVKMRTKKPIVLLTYANIIGVEGTRDEILRNFAHSGVDGLIIADVPVEEAELFKKDLNKHNLDFIQLITPNTSKMRSADIMKIASGFMYLVAVSGVTGARNEILNETKERIVYLKDTDEKSLPICVGFGISKPEHVSEIISLGADGAIVGSAIIKIIEQNLDDKKEMVNEIKLFTQKMKYATKRNDKLRGNKNGI